MAEEKKQQVKIDNTALVEAIQILKADRSQENLNKVIKLIQTGKFICPAQIVENTEAVEKEDGRVALENKRTFRFNAIANKEGKRYIAVFTSRAEITAGNSPFEDNGNMLILDVVSMLSAFKKPENDKDLEGIVIDPFSNNFSLPKNILRRLAETEVFTPKPNEQVKISPPEKFPDGFLDTLREKLDEDGRVNQMFVLVLERANKAKNLLMIVDDEAKLSADERKELFTEITRTIGDYTKGMHLMFVPYADDFAQQATNNRLPCYRR